MRDNVGAAVLDALEEVPQMLTGDLVANERT
jgi:hypothetical protein